MVFEKVSCFELSLNFFSQFSILKFVLKIMIVIFVDWLNTAEDLDKTDYDETTKFLECWMESLDGQPH